MRKLKINKIKKEEFNLYNTPIELQWIEAIAKEYANTLAELQQYFDAGVGAYTEFEINADKKMLEKFKVHTVRQAILSSIKAKNKD